MDPTPLGAYGPESMDSKLYEELCRIYLADQFGVSVEAITSRVIKNPQRPGEPEFSHQIDHYWETGPAVALYVNIANAKWRTTDKADQGEVLAVHAVKEMIRAHKALLITSTDFTAGARGLAAQQPPAPKAQGTKRGKPGDRGGREREGRQRRREPIRARRSRSPGYRRSAS